MPRPAPSRSADTVQRFRFETVPVGPVELAAPTCRHELSACGRNIPHDSLADSTCAPLFPHRAPRPSRLPAPAAQPRGSADEENPPDRPAALPLQLLRAILPSGHLPFLSFR